MRNILRGGQNEWSFGILGVGYQRSCKPILCGGFGGRKGVGSRDSRSRRIEEGNTPFWSLFSRPFGVEPAQRRREINYTHLDLAQQTNRPPCVAKVHHCS